MEGKCFVFPILSFFFLCIVNEIFDIASVVQNHIFYVAFHSEGYPIVFIFKVKFIWRSEGVAVFDKTYVGVVFFPKVCEFGKSK